MRPSIDHGILSPSGHVSKASRRAAEARTRAELFPAGYWDTPEPTTREKVTQEVERLRRQAAELRALADRGMSPRKYRTAAEKLEAEALALTPSTTER